MPTSSDPPTWAMRLARKALPWAPHESRSDTIPTVARAIADAVDAARVEAANEASGRADTGGHYDDIMALRGKEPKR